MTKMTELRGVNVSSSSEAKWSDDTASTNQLPQSDWKLLKSSSTNEGTISSAKDVTSQKTFRHESINLQQDDTEAEETNTPSSMPSARLLITGIFVVLSGSFHFGYQLSIVNPMAEPLQKFMIESLESKYSIKFTTISARILWSTVAGIMFLGAVIGANIVPYIMIKIGSRRSLIAISTITFFGVGLSPLSMQLNRAELFIISRLIAGICVGMGTTVQGVFLTEISPVSCRGLMGTMAGLATNIGAVMGSAVGLPQLLGTPLLWPGAFCIEMIPCLLLFLYAVCVLHESPLYYLRRADEVSFSGVVAITMFGTFLFEAIGFTASKAALANCIATLAGTVGVIFGALTIDKVGRRFLIVISLLSLIAVDTGMMVLVWAFQNYGFAWLSYTFLLLFVIFLFLFSVGVGPVAWFISTELAGPSARARVQALSISAQYITCFLCPIIYSPLEKFAGPLSFLLFIIPLSCAVLYIYCYMPETRNRSADKIRTLLETGKRKF